MDDIMAKLGIKSIHLVIGLIGGVVSFIFGEKKSKLQSFFIFLMGAITTAYVTPMLLLWQPQLKNIEHGIAFIVGIFGMGIIEFIFKFLYELKKKPIRNIINLWKR